MIRDVVKDESLSLNYEGLIDHEDSLEKMNRLSVIAAMDECRAISKGR
jgi:hypothetical protein